MVIIVFLWCPWCLIKDYSLAKLISNFIFTLFWMFQVIFKVRSTIFELNHQTVIWLFSLMSFWNFWVFKHRCQELSLYTVWCQSWTLKLTLNCSAQVWWFLIAVVFICTRRPPTLWFAHFSITISVIPLGELHSSPVVRNEEMTPDSHLYYSSLLN